MGLKEQLELVLDANIGGFVSKMEAAGHSAEHNLSKADSSLDKVGGRLQITGAAMVGFGALALTGMGQAAHAAEEAELANLKLQNSISHNPTMAGESSAAFEDLATQLMQVTVFDDEATKSMEAYLIQVGLTKGQVLQLTPAIADLAAKSGIDLDTAAKKVTLAINGKKKGLEALLGPLDAATYSTDRYKAVTDALGKVQGFATDQGKTFDGQVAILTNNLKELEEGVGKGAVEAFGHMFSGIESVTGALNSLNPHSQELIGQVVTFGGVALVGVGALSMLAGTVLKARDNFAGLTSMLGLHSGATTADTVATEGATVAHLADAAAAEAEALALGEEAAAAEVATAASAGLAGGLMAGGLIVAAAVGVFAALADSTDHNAKATDEYTAAVQKNTGSLQENIDEVTASNLEHNAAAKAAHDAGASWKTLIDTVRQGTDDFGGYNRILADSRYGLDNVAGTAQKMAQALRDAGAGSTQYGQSLIDGLESGNLSVQAARNLNNEMEGLRNGFHDGTAAAKEHKEIIDGLNGSTVDYTAAVKGLHDEMHALMDPLFGAEKALQDNQAAQRAVTEATLKHAAAVQAASDAVAKYGGTSSEAQAAQLQVLATEDDLQQAQMKVAESALSVNDATLQLEAAMKSGDVSIGGARDQLNQWVAQGLLTQQSAMEVADKLGLVVDKTNAIAQQSDLFVKVDADTSDAEAKLENFLNMVRNSSGTVVLGGSSLAMQVKDVGGYVAGGRGQPVPIIAHGGEYVLTVDQTDAMIAANSSPVPTVSFAGDAPLPGDAPLADQWRHVSDVAASHSRAHDVMHSEGDISDDQYLTILRNRLAATEKYSDDYDRIWQQIKQITDKGLHAQEEVAKQHARAHDNQYAEGELSDAEYLSMLQKRLAATDKYSDEYDAIWQKIGQITEKGLKDQAAVAADHQRRHDVMHDEGVISDAEYLAMLQNRLSQTEQYSDDYDRILKQIQSIDDRQQKTAADRAQAQQDLEDREHAHGLIANENYRKLLEDRLAELERFSTEWFQINDEIAAIDKQASDAAAATAAHDLEILRNRVAAGVASRDELIASLRQAETGIEQYSDAWMSLEREIGQLQSQQPAANNTVHITIHAPGADAATVQALSDLAPQLGTTVQEALDMTV